MFLTRILWRFTDILLSPKTIRGSKQNLALARALVLVTLSIISISILAKWLLFPSSYQPSSYEQMILISSTGITLLLLLTLRFTSNIKLVGALLCIVILLSNVAYISIDQSALSTQYIWLILLPVMALTFVGIGFGFVCTLITMATFYLAIQYPSKIPAIFNGDLNAFAYNQNTSLMLLSFLLFIVVSGFYLVSHYMLDTINKKSNQLSKANKALEALSYLDELTGLFSRSYFESCLPTLWKQNLRDKTPISLLLIDIDHFKSYNAKHGRSAGDKCLKTVAKALKKSFHRPSDAIFHWGGDIFLALLSNVDEEGTRTVAEHIRKELDACRILHETSGVSPFLTATLGGICVIPEDESAPKNLIKRLIQQLHRAKEKGRDCIEIKNYSTQAPELHLVSSHDQSAQELSP